MKLVEIDESIEKYLRKRNILKQYLIAKMHAEADRLNQIDFRKRRPYKYERYYFKINNKYRAIGRYNDKGTFVVLEISDHQE